MSDLIGWFSLATPLHVHLTKAGVKAWFYAHALQGVWSVSRDYLLDYRIWLLAVIPCLLLETFLPAMMESESRHASRWLDFVYPIFGGILLAPFTGIMIAGIDRFFRTNLPYLNTGLLDHKPLVLQVLGAFLIMDLASYVSHYLRHKVKWLWYFHTIHHSQENLNPFTANRAHFAEAVISSAILTVPIAFVGGPPLHWTLYLVLSKAWTYFIHSNVKTNLGPVGSVVVTPQFHRVHHSTLPEHYDKNFGERLVLWDWLFGTLVRDTTVYPPTGVTGIERWAVEGETGARAIASTWMRQTAYPFVKIWGSIQGALRAGPVHAAPENTSSLSERRATAEARLNAPAPDVGSGSGRQLTAAQGPAVKERSA